MPSHLPISGSPRTTSHRTPQLYKLFRNRNTDLDRPPQNPPGSEGETGTFPFLSLPPELRNQIYYLTFSNAGSTVLLSSTGTVKNLSFASRSRPVHCFLSAQFLCTCRQVYEEGIQYLYVNRFISSNGPGAFVRLFADESPRRRELRRLVKEVRLMRQRGPFFGIIGRGVLFPGWEERVWNELLSGLCDVLDAVENVKQEGNDGKGRQAVVAFFKKSECDYEADIDSD